MTQSKSERIHKSEAARQRRREIKDIIYATTARLYSRMRKQRKKK
jgi:hypothetical protein